MLGEIILEKEFHEKDETLDITGLHSGMYMVNIISESKSDYCKLYIARSNFYIFFLRLYFNGINYVEEGKKLPQLIF